MNLSSGQSESWNINQIKHSLIAALPTNLDQHSISMVEESVLRELGRNKMLNRVVVNFEAVQSSDLSDLDRLQGMLLAIKLLGRKVVLCGISPGMAGLIIQCGVSLHHNAICLDIDSALEQVNHA